MAGETNGKVICLLDEAIAIPGLIEVIKLRLGVGVEYGDEEGTMAYL
jgi:hypothetical protein